MAAKIYRINYKSDFILTLTSDAGWTTPFCIKFWTGAPAMAYYAGWDGETYTHCVYDPAEPTKLVVQFDDHRLPVGDLKFQIGYHFTVADFPNDTEDEVINPASIVTEINGEEYQVMLDFSGETAPEIEFALPAYANEQQRIANEQQRIANEQQRIAAEEQRVEEFGAIEQQAQQVIGEAGSAAQAAYEAAGEAANVNAELDGTILTITNRQGTSTSVNTKGEQGEQGNPGQAATISVGTTTTGAPGTSAQVTNSGTSSAAVLDFTIPQGAKGDKGDQGEPGEVTEAEMNAALALKEDKANKVTEIDDNSTDVQYPSAKGVWTAIKNVIAAIKQWATSLFARTDGYYSRMIVGGAESVIGDVPQTATYTFRRTGGGAIGEPVARLTEVQGNTGVVNQLVDLIDGTRSLNDITYSLLANGKAKISGTASAAVSTLYIGNSENKFVGVVGHKYYLNCPSQSTDGVYIQFVGIDARPTSGSTIFTCSNVNTAGSVVVWCDSGAVVDFEGYIYARDLTLEYGAGNEPGTVADFEARIWRDYGKTLDEYIAYTQGKLINCKALALESYNTDSELIDTINLNLTTLTGINPTTGVRETIFPNGAGGGDGWRDVIKVVNGATVAVVNTARDTLGNVSSNYVYYSSNSHTVRCSIDVKAYGRYNILCDRYATSAQGSHNGLGDKEIIGINQELHYVYIKDNSFGDSGSDLPSIIAALADVVVEFQLATPIVYTDLQHADGTPFVLPTNFEVQNDGTERITHAEGEDSIAPVMSAIYGLNAVGFVQDAPKEYTSQATLDSLTSLLSSLTGHTITKTWDAANNKWVFS